jgi:alpha-tubulin suppressor-like RCC1 family protein
MRHTCRYQNRPLTFQSLAFAIICFLTSGGTAWALPRNPLPPVPEFGILYYQGFDRFHAVATGDAQAAIPGLGLLVESWSGYALDRSGPNVLPFIVPALSPNTGHTNIVCDASGAIRFWYEPYFSSSTLAGGTGPGAVVHLADLVAASANSSVLVWSLQISGDGTVLELLGNSDSGPVELVSTLIQWQANQSHMIALDYGPMGTALLLDGQVVAQGAGTVAIPSSVGALSLGSSISGTATAQGAVDEFYSLDHPLTPAETAFYYRFAGPAAALGPISGKGEASSVLIGGSPSRATRMSLTRVYDPDHDTTCSPGGAVYIPTNSVSAFLQTNGLTTISFDIQGGTNGVLYDIYTTSFVTNSLTNHQWNWLGQGLTCNSYTFSNQPANLSFYVLAAPAQTMAVATGNNGSGQCNVPAGLSNSTAVAGGGYFSVALQNNGTVVAWGDNAYGETNVPAGITNAVAVAAGQYHGLALLTNGAVTNWGFYWDGGHFYSVTNYAGLAGPPTSNVMAIAAGAGHDLALLSNGTVICWGLTNLFATSSNALAFQSNLTGVKAIAAGWNHNVALLSNGLVKAWALGATNLAWNLTNVPPDLTNAVAIAAYGLHSLALRTNGTVEAWGYSPNGETNVPAGLTNVVAISAGGFQSLALQANGMTVIWGLTSLTNIPPGLVAAKTVSGGFEHNLVLQSDLLTPVILQQPTDQYAPAGTIAIFSVQAESLAGVQYQWQFNGVNLTGGTNASLILTNVQATNNGSYDVVVSTGSGSLQSSTATLTLVTAPQVIATIPPANSTNWEAPVGQPAVVISAIDQAKYPLTYLWTQTGTNQPGGYNTLINYSLTVTNIAGTTTNMNWTMRSALPGEVIPWGDNDSGECTQSFGLTNAVWIAAGLYQSLAVTEAGAVVQWGEYSDGTDYYAVTNFTNASPPPASGVIAVAAGMGQALALLTNGTVVAWGLTNAEGYAAYGTSVPAGISNVIAVSCGWQFDVALLSNGTVRAWGLDNTNIGYTMTNVPTGLSNVTAIAAGGLHTLALTTSNTVVAWGYNSSGECNVPAGLTNGQTNIVAIASGDYHSLALTSNGTVVAWGDNSSGQCNVPTGLSNVLAIAAGSSHSLALKNDGTFVAWGENSSGQANVPNVTQYTVIPGAPYFVTNFAVTILTKMIAAGGDHNMAAIFNPAVQYQVNVPNDLLLIYNTNSLDSSNVCQYYMTHRPMVSTANRLGIGVTTNDPMLPQDYTNKFLPQVQAWLSNNPTKRPLYVILFQNIPQELDYYTNTEDASDCAPSVQYQLHNWAARAWQPYVTAINMNGTSGTNFNSSDGTNDCIAYINKLTNMAGTNLTSLFISASATGYGNTNWYFDGAKHTSSGLLGLLAEAGVTNVNPSASVFGSTNTHYPNYIANATNVAGYWTEGWDGGTSVGGTNDGFMFVDGTIRFSGNSGWYLMATIDSFNGQRQTFQANYLSWFSANAFGGANYSNTPIGGITHVNEPFSTADDLYDYFARWELGRCFALCAWCGPRGIQEGDTCPFFQAVGDPFVRR